MNEENKLESNVESSKEKIEIEIGLAGQSLEELINKLVTSQKTWLTTL